MADGTDLTSLPGLELARLVRSREVSRREVLAAHLDRVERLNPVVNAIVERRDAAALEEADAADRTHDDRVGLPLDGVPIDHMRDIVWVNLLSLPSVALPNGIQIVARRFREDEAFAAAGVAAEMLGPVTVAEPAAEAVA